MGYQVELTLILFQCNTTKRVKLKSTYSMLFNRSDNIVRFTMSHTLIVLISFKINECKTTLSEEKYIFLHFFEFQSPCIFTAFVQIFSLNPLIP